MQIVPRYRSGQEIQKGDRVLFNGNPAEIELVAFDSDNPERAWYVQEFGGGVLVTDPTVSGRTFIATDERRIRRLGIYVSGSGSQVKPS